MALKTLLIANRGEIAIRIARAASELGIRTVGIYSTDDARSLHVRAVDEAVALEAGGVPAYLDTAALLSIAKATGCDALHPGYGFLSENADFAASCAATGVKFVGPNVLALELFGDKAKAREAARLVGIPLLPGTHGPTSVDEARDFMTGLGAGAAVMIKAVSGGGGRGMRAVTDIAALPEAFERCQSEAAAAFGNDAVYVEKFAPRARHIEVQIVGDGHDVTHLWERECTLQRQNQKLVEIAPSPSLSSQARDAIISASIELARHVQYDSLGTLEFLVDAEDDQSFSFMEANPRLQVEHTVTEEVCGVDLVKAQLRLAGGERLAEVGLAPGSPPAPQGFAIQVRVNMETMSPSGEAIPSAGTIRVYEPPSGPGVRVDGCGYAGYRPSPRFDSLLAKVIAHSPSANFIDALARARRALAEFRIEGVDVNLDMLRSLLSRPEIESGQVYTRFVEDHIAELSAARLTDPSRFFESSVEENLSPADHIVVADGLEAILAPMLGCVIAIQVSEGDLIPKGATVAIFEAMKMEHVVVAEKSGHVRTLHVSVGALVDKGAPILSYEEAEAEEAAEYEPEVVDFDLVRPDLAKLRDYLELGHDTKRPAAVERRRTRGKRTARENINDLIDPGSFLEIAPLVVARTRDRSFDDLMAASPGDGVIAGIASVNGEQFDQSVARTMVMSYDYTVFAGTQGMAGHVKSDRVIEMAEQAKLPFILFAEGGGGRLNDISSDMGGVDLDVETFARFAHLNGQVPLVGMTSGYCFAGNAALLGTCDVIIATEDANIGMGGPSMIEGGGLGVYKATEIGPAAVQRSNGVIDLLVKDEAQGVLAAKGYLSYFQGNLRSWTAADQRLLRTVIPENRLRAYDVRKVIELLADEASVMDLRSEFGVGIITALARIEGKPVGLLANNPRHLGGAIDADASDKAARFMQLCNAFGLPLISLVDTPGFMVGPEIERRAQVRHTARMMVAAAHLSVPFLSVVLRKGYGLGALAMTAGGFHSPFMNISWPTGEFGGANIEGTVRISEREHLASIADLGERDAEFRRIVSRVYEKGSAINTASFCELDAVIDPAETRRWLAGALVAQRRRAAPPRHRIDTW